MFRFIIKVMGISFTFQLMFCLLIRRRMTPSSWSLRQGERWRVRGLFIYDLTEDEAPRLSEEHVSNE